MKDNKHSFVTIGIATALLALLCCLGPVILIALGVGTASAVIAIRFHKLYFVAGAAALLIFTTWWYFQRRKQITCDRCGSSRPDVKQVG